MRATTKIEETDQQLLVVGTGSRRYREYLLRSISTRFRIHLFLTEEPSWEREYASGWTVLQSTLDSEEMCRAARRLAAEQPIDGVLCWDEARVLATSHVAATLGLPGGDPGAVVRCRDKHLTRLALASASVAQPLSVLVGTVAEAVTAADRIGYPVVLKPRALAASLGVVKVRTPAELAGKFDFTEGSTVPEAPRYDVSVLVEEFVGGPEISVDCAVHAGAVTPLFVARKVVGYAPYFEEVGHRVNARDPLLADPRIVGILRDTHQALGFTDGMTHVELKLTEAGPKVIEVNARLGGDLIPYLGLRATGIDPGLVAAEVACGRPPHVHPCRGLVAGVRFFYPERDDTVVTGIRFDPGPSLLPPSIDLMVTLAEPGTTVSPPPKGTLWGRIAYATAVGVDATECDGALDAAGRALRVSTAAPALSKAGRP